MVAMPAAADGLAPAKPAPIGKPSVPNPDVIRQGSDTFADAVLLPNWVANLEGTTTGFTDDYDEECPYTQSTSPDVVYRYTPHTDETVEIDLLGSEYDTKVYVYGAGMMLVACNDDFYPDYVSKIECLCLDEGTKYYIVIDGYGGAHGNYVFTLFGPPPADKSEAGEECRWSTVKSLFD